MEFLEFDQDLLPERSNHLVDELCWRAQEVLHSYNIADDVPALFETSAVPPGAEEAPEAEEIEDVVSWIRTLEINFTEELTALMDNMPLLVDDEGCLQQLTEPGFVAIHISEAGDFEGMMQYRTLHDVGDRTDQIIVRLPWHLEGSGIFRGFYIDDSNKVDEDVSLKNALHSFLEDFVDAQRDRLKFSSSTSDAVFAVENSPTEPVACSLIRMLQEDN